jgi:hypothetical protein
MVMLLEEAVLGTITLSFTAKSRFIEQLDIESVGGGCNDES